MGTTMALAIGVLLGAGLGATGMFLFIKETETDMVIERQAEDKSIDIDDPWDTEELPEPKEEIKYGSF